MTFSLPARPILQNTDLSATIAQTYKSHFTTPTLYWFFILKAILSLFILKWKVKEKKNTEIIITKVRKIE